MPLLRCRAVSSEPRVLTTCSVCHIRFDVSARSHRDIKAGRKDPRCVMHARRNARPETVVATHRRYWLDRFSIDEIVEMATAIWPRPRIGPLSLTAGTTPPRDPE